MTTRTSFGAEASSEVQECLAALRPLDRFATLAAREVAVAGVHGDLAAAQRLWCMALAAAETPLLYRSRP